MRAKVQLVQFVKVVQFVQERRAARKSAVSRTRDQMFQAARSGVQNIAEGSQSSGTSKKTELKLTNVARASLEELRRDYLDFLRQGGFSERLYRHRQWAKGGNS